MLVVPPGGALFGHKHFGEGGDGDGDGGDNDGGDNDGGVDTIDSGDDKGIGDGDSGDNGVMVVLVPARVALNIMLPRLVQPVWKIS